jgi:selenocysteine-specific elongation factor
MHVVATAGHVDHGKSTLVRALTGMEPDRWAEERRRGMTIDLGFAWTTLPGGDVVAFVDVPGHERFVATMVAGVGPVPAVLFVVAADGGWAPQSTEHLAAINAFEVEHGLLVVTRADLADPGKAMDEARDRLADTSLAGIGAVAVSAVTGQGLDELRTRLADLVGALPPGDVDQDVRLWVDRSFVITGAGTIITGTLTGGSIAVGDTLALASSGRRVSVRAVQCLGRSVLRADPVARVALNLRGIDHDEVGRGDALLSPGVWLHTHEVDVRLRYRPGTDRRDRSQPALPAATSHLTLHVGTAAVPARLRPLGGSVCRVRLATALPLRIGDRGLLREPSNHDVLLGATVLDPQPPPLRRRGAAARRAAELGDVADADVAAAVADEMRRRGVVSRSHLRRLGVRGDLPAPIVGDWLVDADLRISLGRRLVEIVDAHARQHPLEPGLPVGAAVMALDLPDGSLVAALAPPGLVVVAGRVRAADADPGLPGMPGLPGLPALLVERIDRLHAMLVDLPFAAPEAPRLVELGLGHREIAAAVRAGALLVLAGGVVLLPDAPARARERLIPLAEPFTVSQAKQAWQTSRRVAVPLLELLDSTGVTERLADGTRRLTER